MLSCETKRNRSSYSRRIEFIKEKKMTHSSSLMVLFLLCVSSTYATKVVDENTICSKAKNSSFCSTLLKSKPGSSKDLVSLAQYAVEVVHANITNSSNLITKLLAQSGSDKAARFYYSRCLYHFGEEGGALASVKKAENELKMGDYKGLDESMTDIWYDVFICLTRESPSDPPYHNTSLLPKYGQVIYQVINIIHIIISYLVKG